MEVLAHLDDGALGRMTSAKKQFILIALTFAGGALGFYAQDRFELHYKEERFKRFEKSYEAQMAGRGK